MPRGYQWSHEDYRNAERAAKIQAQAIIEAQRKEQARQEREARRYTSTPHVEAPRSKPAPAPRVYLSAYEEARAKKEADERMAHRIAKMRAEKATAAIFGTEEYIHNRYGHVVWTGKVTEYRNKFACSEEEAVTLLVRDYKEEEWVPLEDPLIEMYMGHRK